MNINLQDKANWGNYIKGYDQKRKKNITILP